MKRVIASIATMILLAALPAAVLASEDVEGARRAFMEGKKAYNIGEYETAIAYYKEGYSLAARPDFLYNIGQCYFQLKNWDRARFFYERYLSEAPDAGDADEVRGLIVDLDERIAAESGGGGGSGSGYGDGGGGAGAGYGADGGTDYGDDDDGGYGDDDDDFDYEPEPRPTTVRKTVKHSGRLLIAVSVGLMPTSLCYTGLLIEGDCFVGLIGDVNIKLFDPPKVVSVFLDLSIIAYTDRFERGALVGVGPRIRFDKFFRFVPYALAVFYAGYGSGSGGGQAFRVSSRFAIGGEISLRRGTGGGGVGLFLEGGFGTGRVFSNYSYGNIGYGQLFVAGGATFP